jgi:hypothetical protein
MIDVSKNASLGPCVFHLIALDDVIFSQDFQSKHFASLFFSNKKDFAWKQERERKR